jgi:hypothetical protein
MNDEHGQTGRTTRMIAHARRLAIEDRRAVYIVAANPHDRPPAPLRLTPIGIDVALGSRMSDQWAVMLREIHARTERLRAMAVAAQAINLKLATAPPPRTAGMVKS